MDETKIEEIKASELKIINHQKPENLYKHPRGSVEVVSIFLTVQGEGPFSGCPAVFIRTAGCNLDCPLCDSDYTTGRQFLTPPQIVDRVHKLRPRGLVVITGGEPFRQNITPLTKLLINAGRRVQIETNGTYHWDDFPYASDSVCIVCSPKTPKLHPKLSVDFYKYVIEYDKVSEEDGLPISVLGNGIAPARPRPFESDLPIYVSPADEYDPEKNQKNLEMAIHVCLKFNYMLSTQQQKGWELP